MRTLGLKRSTRLKESLIIEDESSNDDFPFVREKNKRAATTSKLTSKPLKRVLSGDLDSDFDPDWIGDEYLGKFDRNKHKSHPKSNLSKFVQLTDDEDCSPEADITAAGQTLTDLDDATFVMTPGMKQALNRGDSINEQLRF